MQALALLTIVIAHNLHDTIAASTKRGSNEGVIHFPENIDLVNTLSADDIPEECKNELYCTIKPKNYPEEQFNKLLKNTNHLPPPTMLPQPMLTNRLGDIDEKKICESKEDYASVYLARSKRDSEWKIVVQASDAGYKQKVHTETCLNEGGRPDTNLFLPSNEYDIFCKQVHRKFEMIILNGTSLVADIVDVPICCSCEIKLAPIESRFGDPKEIPPTKKP